jgi:hypothetical protein
MVGTLADMASSAASRSTASTGSASKGRRSGRRGAPRTSKAAASCTPPRSVVKPKANCGARPALYSFHCIPHRRSCCKQDRSPAANKPMLSYQKPMFAEDDERRPLPTEDELYDACMTRRPSSSRSCSAVSSKTADSMTTATSGRRLSQGSNSNTLPTARSTPSHRSMRQGPWP